MQLVGFTILSRVSNRGETSFVLKKWGNLLNISKFSAPKGLLEWIVDMIDLEKVKSGVSLDESVIWRTCLVAIPLLIRRTSSRALPPQLYPRLCLAVCGS